MTTQQEVYHLTN